MPLRIEDYALVGDMHTGALVGIDGSIDWLCLPRFDSGAVFASLLGNAEHGRWLLAPAGGIQGVRRRYQDATLVLETEFATGEGTVRIIDFMPYRRRYPMLVRLVEGVKGRVPMHMELVLRFDYGWMVPWVRRHDTALIAVAGPDAVALFSGAETAGENLRTIADFSVGEGERIPFVLAWYPSHVGPPSHVSAERLLAETKAKWLEWSERCAYEGDYKDEVVRSLITLKALTYEPTGGIVAAPTTSLPEKLGGVRNWDYRFVWLRDAALTLQALLSSGYADEAREWRDWLLRAVAGKPSQAQIMYGLGGERRLTELELDWLPGYENSAPVRIGNAAVDQFQIDVYGEVMDALHLARREGLPPNAPAWRLERRLMDFLESHWQEPDEGIWEVRGPRHHFTHSKVMAWVAFDRAIKATERYGLEGPTERWRGLRSQIHAEVCEKAFDASRGTFTQFYGSRELDASVLLIPLVGFLPVSDGRVRGTMEWIERELFRDGLLLRYSAGETGAVDGLPGSEGAFLACSFWLADNYLLAGRRDDARRLFHQLLGLSNDVGLLSEEYDLETKRLVGNFPQAFSHVSVVNTVRNLNRYVERDRREL